VLTEGQRHESPEFDAVWAPWPQAQCLTHAIREKAYDSNHIRAKLAEPDIVPVIPPKSNRTEAVDYDKDLYKFREKVERFFNKLKQFRRIATRDEKLSHTFLALIHLVAAWLITK
jgi:transposase